MWFVLCFPWARQRGCAGWRGIKGCLKQWHMVPAPRWGRGDSPSFPDTRGCRRCHCTGILAASSTGGQIVEITGPEFEPRVTKCFPGISGNLGQPEGERKVRCYGERWSVLEQKVFPCWIYWITYIWSREREYRTFSVGYRMKYPLIRNQP